MNKEALRVPVEKLRHTCSPDILESVDTSDTKPLKDFIGQDRAIEALKLGLEIESHGYNIVVTGFNGTGRQSAIKEHLKRFAEKRKNQGNVFLHDFCFVFNFTNPDKPKILIFKNGDGKKFQSRMEETMKTISRQIPAVFQGDDYVKARNKIQEGAGEKIKKLSEFLQGKLKEANFGLIQVRAGQMMPVPLSLDPAKAGEVMSDNELENLSSQDEEKISEKEKIREKIENNRKKIFRMMEKIVMRQRAIFEEAQKKIEDLEKEKVKELLEPIFETSEYQDYPEVVEYFTGCKDCILNNFQCFKPQESNGCFTSAASRNRTTAKVNLCLLR